MLRRLIRRAGQMDAVNVATNPYRPWWRVVPRFGLFAYWLERCCINGQLRALEDGPNDHLIMRESLAELQEAREVQARIAALRQQRALAGKAEGKP